MKIKLRTQYNLEWPYVKFIEKLNSWPPEDDIYISYESYTYKDFEKFQKLTFIGQGIIGQANKFNQLNISPEDEALTVNNLGTKFRIQVLNTNVYIVWFMIKSRPRSWMKHKLSSCR
jgi:hypothetical protein